MASLFGLPALVAGICLLVAGQDWFAGAYKVGLILTIVGAVMLLLTWVASEPHR